MQEDAEGVYAEVEFLLTLNQFNRICPQAVSTIYCDLQSLVRGNRDELAMSIVISTIAAPIIILTWNEIPFTFEQMRLAVSI